MTREDFLKRFKHGISVSNALECYEPFDRNDHEDTVMTVERNVVDPEGQPHDFKIHIDYWDGTNKDFYNFEEIWHNPMITQEYFNFLRDEGYDHIRLPININRHYIDIPNQVVDPLWLKHIREVITMINNTGLPVMLTLQNDLVDLMQTHYSFQSLCDDNYTIYQDNTARTLKIWEILATELNDFSNDDLIFDLISEMRFYDISFTDQSKASDMLIKLFQLLLETVRKTGGNNSDRLVIISGHYAEFESSDQFMESFDDKFDDKCILGFNFYEPWEFTLINKRNEWGSSIDDQRVFNIKIDHIISAFRQGIPLFIHEYAAGVSNDENHLKNTYDVCKWIYLVTKRFSEAGIPLTYWDPGNLINRDTFEYKIPFFREMITTALNGESFDINKAIEENPFDFHEWWER